MATLETQQLDDIIVKSRRKMLSLSTSALAGLVMAGIAPKNAAAQATLMDSDYLNFALNLEYLEANFYSLAVNGVTIDKLSTPIPITGTGTQGVVVTKPNFAPVPFVSTIVKAYAQETAIEEGKHVVFLQKALSTAAVAQPQIDLVNSFYALAMAAGIVVPAPGFDPFANDANFLIGAYIFEDVGVTAYHGAAGALTVPANLTAAAGILAVEAYHAGLIRTTINAVDAAAAYAPTGTLTGYTQQISALRSKLANPTPPAPPTPFTTNGGLTADDQGIDNSQMVALNGTAASYPSTTILDADNYSITFARSPAQILAIVTHTLPTAPSPHTGLFFPNGLNGNVN
jgi:hypothetical protein